VLFELFCPVDTVLLYTVSYCIASVLINKTFIHSLQYVPDLHVAQLMPLPLTVSCFSKIQISFTFLAPAHPGSSRQRAVERTRVLLVHSLKIITNSSLHI